jgi:hypothetical protein
MKLQMYSLSITIRAFPSEGRTTWVRRYFNLITRVLMLTVLPLLPVRKGTHTASNRPDDTPSEVSNADCDSPDWTSRAASLLMTVGKP